jgi:beta-fructofuranosidase
MKKLLFLLMVFLLIHFTATAQEKPAPVPALVNKDQDISKEVIKATREFRARLLSDPYRPAYHFCFPEDDGRPGDPNGAFYHNGRYHLMFLYNSAGSGFTWGHVSSTDLLHWRFHPDAIGPGNGDEGCFSGGGFVDDDGSAIISYWMLWGDKGIGLARSTDSNFDKWEKFENNPVIKSTEWGITEMKDATGNEVHVGSADPSNIWKKDGKYYMLTGNLLVLNKYGRDAGSPASEKGDRLYLFESKDLRDWTYLHRFYESRRDWTDASEDNMCPTFFPLPSSPDGGKPGDKYLMISISHNKGCKYYIGDYRDDRFYPEVFGRMSWKDNTYFAPEALLDDRGRQIMWSWIFDDRPDSVKSYYGWTGTYGLPRSLWLRSDGTLGMSPVKELETLRMKETRVSGVKVRSGHEIKLQEPGTELMELEVTILPGNALQCGVKVCMSDDGREETSIWYDRTDNKLKFDTQKSGLAFGRKIIEEAPLELKNGEPLVLRIFIDRSIVEVFANDKQAIARMVYPTLGGRGISLFSGGGDIEVNGIKMWELSPANPY